MSFTESIKTCFQKYIDFSSRASRSEYWWFLLFHLIVSVALSIVALGTFFLTFLGWIFALMMLLPSLAVTVRRLHDTNRTGWWLLFPFGMVVVGLVGVMGLMALPPMGFVVLGLSIALLTLTSMIGYLVLLVFLIRPSDQYANKYGPNPSQPQQGMGGFGNTQSGHPYNPPPAGGYGTSGYGAAQPEPSPESDTDERRFCTQCGMHLQADARFCTVCGTAA